MGYQSPAAKAAKTQEGEGKIIGIVVADRFFNENTFYSNLYRALLRAGINRKSVMLTVGYPPPTILPGRWLPAKASPRRKPPL